MADDDKREPNSGKPTPDPVADSSLSGPILVFSVLLFLSLVWALYDELVVTRPWKAYQEQFGSLYSSYLKKLGPRQAAADKAVRSSSEFAALDEKLKAAEQAAAPGLSTIDDELKSIRQRLAVIKEPFQDVRAKVAALTYDLEHTAGDGGKESIREEIAEIEAGPFRIAWPDDGGEEDLTADQLKQFFNELQARESELNAERVAATSEARALARERNQHLSDNLAGLNPRQIDGLLRKMEEFSIDIKQIHIERAGLIDRCESCHLGVREPVTITAADVGGNQVFVSHPGKELIAIHDPNEFGCTPCHNGNGLATASVTKAHGDYRHWLWPLFAAENAQAGCVQCHFDDRVLQHAEVLNRGRDLYQLRGCVGCHRHEEYDRELDTLTAVQKEIQNLSRRRANARLEIDREIAKGDAAETNEEAQARYDTAENLRVTNSNLAAKGEALEEKAKFLMQDRKMVGPNLKEVRLKLRKEWIPVWLSDPPAFRPGTKMPRFRLADEEVRALSAFVWQSGWTGPGLESRTAGDAVNGKELFEIRGCLACHSMGEGEDRQGGEFAANLSRLGEKTNYDYIVRWVGNPRHRTRPYCAHEGRDLGPEDYARHGLPFQFDLDNSRCPNDGHELQVQNMTVMPNLRLSDRDTRDIATYLMSLKHDDATYSGDVAFMDDPRVAERGKELSSRYGCGSCHEIQGLENAQRIGTELTKEASKPMEQLDFGLLEHQAKGEGWYSHKGFFERKLNNPAVFDEGREKLPADLLRMPKPDLSPEDVQALVTFLLGSLDSPVHGEFRTIPEQLRYIPTDEHRDIQEGWWLIRKYNCTGCHTIRVGQRTVLSDVPRYQDPDWQEQLPPTLIQEGARVNPEWLARFLANPALSERDTNRNGVREYLHARMPTFSFSPHEIRVLVRFFEALAGQPSPYISPVDKPLSNRERQLARALFSSQAAPCLKCHLVGDPRRDRFASAPNFLIAKERLRRGWTGRWMLDPGAISPGTAMPSGLFRRDGERWVFAGPTPPMFRDYTGDHVDLLVRYMFQLTAEEQRRLLNTVPASAAARPAGSVDTIMAANSRD